MASIGSMCTDFGYVSSIVSCSASRVTVAYVYLSKQEESGDRWHSGEYHKPGAFLGSLQLETYSLCCSWGVLVSAEYHTEIR